MKKSKAIVENFILNRIAYSAILSENEKLEFLKYVGYMTSSEKNEIITMI